jgi:cation transport ATPase
VIKKPHVDEKAIARAGLQSQRKKKEKEEEEEEEEKKKKTHACNETKLMHYLSSVYSVTIPLHVSGLLVVHHQEVTVYICNNWYVWYVLATVCWPGWNGTGSIPTRPADSQLQCTTRTNCCIYTLLHPDDGQLASPKHVEV